MDAASNKQFLSRVQDVPGLNGPGYLGVFTHLKNTPKPGEPVKNGGKDFVVGWPCKTIDEQISKAQFIHSSPIFFDVWYCTSRQSEMGINGRGKPKAVRVAKNAMSLKAIWVDVDVKADKPDKNYTTLTDALDAVGSFVKAVGLPPPSALVNSGGGLHVYWISDKPLTPAEWEPYAQGLKALLLREGVKCDAGITTDEARILRVPGTLNHKYNPPKPVVLMSLGQDYNFDQDFLFLSQIAPVRPVAAQPVHIDVTEPGSVFDAPDPAFAALNPMEQLNHKDPHLVAFEPVEEKCPFYADAIATGGKDHDNNLWNVAVLGTVFMENGNAIAHRISQGHPGYTPDSTQALYDRKLADRSNGTVGYPSCAAFEGAGSKSCATCPLKPQGKSPLNIRPDRVAGFTATVMPQSAAAIALNLPAGYELDKNRIINQVEIKKDKFGVEQPTWYPLFWCEIDDAWVQKDPEMLHLHVSTDKGNWSWTAIAPSDFVGAGADKMLVKAKIMFRSEHKARVETFLMAFMAKMKAAAEAQAAVGFGWYRPHGAIEGFAYATRIFRPDGTNIPAGTIDHKIQKNFMPIGTEQGWFDAWNYIRMQHRPDLELQVVASFAGPLMAMSGQNGAMLSVMGERGSGKTYAMELGCAVWGHPTKTRESENSTDKSVEHRLASTANLPAFWDEVTEEAVQAKVFKLTNITTAGSQGSRLTSSRDQTERGSWSTLVVINGNALFKEYIIKKQRAHGAMLNRVLEVWVPRFTPGRPPVGQISDPSIPDRARQRLEYNFGHVGLAYAKLLAMNHAKIETMMASTGAMLSAKFNITKEERMWLACCSALLVAADLANQLPTPVGIDTNGLMDLIARMLRENRDQRANAQVDAGAPEYGEDYLVQFLKERTMATIWTKACTATTPAGRQAAVEWEKQNINSPMPIGLQVRWDKGDNTLRFSKKNFEEWCERVEGRVVSSIVASLKSSYKMFSERKSLGANTRRFEGIPEWVYTINVTPYPELLNALNQGGEGNINSDLGVSTGNPPSAAEVMKLATDVDAAMKVAI